MQLAYNECCKCKYQWHDLPGALAQQVHPILGAVCPKCHSKYWKWLNYKKPA